MEPLKFDGHLNHSFDQLSFPCTHCLLFIDITDLFVSLPLSSMDLFFKFTGFEVVFHEQYVFLKETISGFEFMDIFNSLIQDRGFMDLLSILNSLKVLRFLARR